MTRSKMFWKVNSDALSSKSTSTYVTRFIFQKYDWEKYVLIWKYQQSENPTFIISS